MNDKFLRYSYIIAFCILGTTSCRKKDVIESPPPLIDSIVPKYTDNGKDIKVYVKNSSLVSSENIIFIGGLEAMSDKTKDGSLKVTIPMQTFSPQKLNTELKVWINGKSAVGMIFSNLYPKFLSFTPNKATIGDIISITGANFIPNKDSNIIYFMGEEGVGKRAEVIYIDANTIKVVVPIGAISEYLSIRCDLNDGTGKHAWLYAEKKSLSINIISSYLFAKRSLNFLPDMR